MPAPYTTNKKQMIRFFSLNFKHVFSMEYLYKRIHEWVLDEEYADGDNDVWIEKFYLERVSGNGAKQIWILWRTDKDFVNKFYKFYLNIDFHCLNLTSTEVVHEGTKVKMNKGEVETFIIAWMELDPQGEWNKHFFLRNKWIQNFMLNRVMKRRIEAAEEQLIKDSSRLLGAVKQYFQLESFLPEYAEKSFHEPKGQ
ncbi:hypothetical protein ACFL0V_05135 [Nanoarchaeota archaeon]